MIRKVFSSGNRKIRRQLLKSTNEKIRNGILCSPTGYDHRGITPICKCLMVNELVALFGNKKT